MNPPPFFPSLPHSTISRRLQTQQGCAAHFGGLCLQAAGKAGGVLLTTYGMCLHNADVLAKPATPTNSLFRNAGGEEEPSNFKWDLVILDEGHKVRCQ